MWTLLTQFMQFKDVRQSLYAPLGQNLELLMSPQSGTRNFWGGVKSTKSFLVCLTIVSGFTLSLNAEEGDIYGFSEGYLENLESERPQKVEPLALTKSLASNLDKLDRNEEQDKGTSFLNLTSRQEVTKIYGQEFGYIYSESGLVVFDRFAQKVYRGGVSVDLEEDMRWQKLFGEQTFRRLSEHQINDYLISNPKGRQIYYIKEKLSSIETGIKGGYSFKAKYHFGGYVDLNLKIKKVPQLRSRILVQSAESPWSIFEVGDVVLDLGYKFTKKSILDFNYSIQEKGIRVIGEYKVLPDSCSLFISGSHGNFGRKGSIQSSRIRQIDGAKKSLLLGVLWLY